MTMYQSLEDEVENDSLLTWKTNIYLPILYSTKKPFLLNVLSDKNWRYRKLDGVLTGLKM